jgi:hypothetical protein
LYILSRALLFKEKKYAMLPIIKIVNQNKEKLENFGVDYLKKKQFLPETILNEAALLGWSNIDKETRLEKMKKNENDYLLLDLYNIINEFDIKKIDAELAEFIYTRLYYINNKSLIKRFLKSNPNYRPLFMTEFKSIFRGYFKNYQDVISNWNEDYWQNILELVIVSI